MQLPVFVYGTLRPGASNFWVVEGWVEQAQPATMAGLQLWHLGSYPMVCEGVGRVRGDLLTLDPARYEEALARMDQLEAVDGAAPSTPGALGYWRARRTAILPGCGAPQPEAWVYLGLTKVAQRGSRIVSGDWWDAL